MMEAAASRGVDSRGTDNLHRSEGMSTKEAAESEQEYIHTESKEPKDNSEGKAGVGKESKGKNMEM